MERRVRKMFGAFGHVLLLFVFVGVLFFFFLSLSKS
jgi:hypothetical protein